MSPGPLKLAATVMTLGLVIGGALTQAPSGATGSNTLRALKCTAMRTDPALEAPLYAQREGANGSADGWWCQLPHATMVPSGFRQVSRSVAPLADLYSNYTTQYGLDVHAADGSGSGHEILVTDDVNSSVASPSHLRYPAPSKGSTVSLGHGVEATVFRQGSTDTVTWRYPVHGVPKYLRAVAQVTVSGTGEPESVVIGVARHVRPT